MCTLVWVLCIYVYLEDRGQYQVFLSSSPYLLRQDVSLKSELTELTRPVSRKDPPVFCLPSAVVLSSGHQSDLFLLFVFNGNVGDPTQVLVLSWGKANFPMIY